MLINNNGKISETCFQIKKQYSFATLLSIFPKTGRTHQIRAHVSHAGYPILFDKRYGDSNLDKQIKQKMSSNRLLLHAVSIDFIHPNNGNILHIEAPLDMNIRNFLQTLV